MHSVSSYSYDDFLNQTPDNNNSVLNIVEKYLKNIELRKNINAFTEVYNEESIANAKKTDQELKSNNKKKLSGFVIAVKDIISIEGKKLTCASKILKDFTSLYDATVIKKLKDADAIIIGKTNCDEFAMGSSGENSSIGKTLNPVNEAKVPGGSSSGSAAAVAANFSMGSLGTDTGGSIRQPAGFCGIVGLKPTYGRVSRYGLVAFASSFDQIGPFANNSRDAARILEVIAGHDPLDSTSANIPVPNYLEKMNGDLKNLKIGLPKEYFDDSLNPEIKKSIELKIEFLKSKGVKFVEVSLPHTEYTIPAYYILTTAEASSNLARYDGARYGHRSKNSNTMEEMFVNSRSEGFGNEVKRRIMLGTYVLSSGYYDAYYKKAQKVRRLIQKDFLDVFKNVDCLLTPTSPTTAFNLGEKTKNPLEMYLSDIYTVSVNLAGLPAISIPSGKDKNNLPIGIQLIGKHFDEQTLLKIADVCENNLN
ncbi:MAG: Asp-tRNA(Asn)/Glu-tRNA(Gln) amidotransferase subunit GatA [Bacteroidetes bacterium]|nr:Asp-tRNA(Asn)/Glu-tRNA(Gln) amidotransferase subunit GatA [Bacteroidota bacterium]